MKRFTIVTRPYLLEDLQRLVPVMLELLETYFGSYEGDEQSEPFRHILTLESSSKLDQDSLYEVSKRLAELVSVGLSQREREQVETFKAIFAFLLEWPEQTGGTALLVPGRLLDEVMNDPTLEVMVNHPRLECYTLPIKKSPDVDTYWIAKESYWQSFRSNPPSNILHFKSPEFQGCDFIDFVYGRNRLRARYQKLLPHQHPLAFPKSPYHAKSTNAGWFFKEVKIQNQTSERGAFVKDVYLNSYSDEGEFDKYETVGWLNPLVLTFDVSADDIPESEAGATTRGQKTLHLFTRGDLLVQVEPHMSQADSYHIELLGRLEQKQKRQRQEQSFLEYALWGAEGTESWESFFVLDSLGGEFIVKDFGKTRMRLFDQRPEHPSLVWKAPSYLSKNSLWLKSFMLQGSQWEENGEVERPDDVLMSSVMPGFQSARGFRRLTVDGVGQTNEPPIFAVLDSLPKRTIAQVSASDEIPPGQATQKTLESLLDWTHTFLKDIYREAKLTNTETYLGEGSYQVIGTNTVQFDELSFLEGFAKSYLSPQSPIYVILPLIEKENKLANVEVVKSVPYGSKELLRRLFSASEASAFQKVSQLAEFDKTTFEKTWQTDVLYGYAWWQVWFDLLFTRPWDVEINFISDRDGFMLMRSKLSQARLGRTMIGNTYKVEEMRI